MPNYQVFISRKNLDKSGDKASDVVIAQELYDHLSASGVNVFLDDVSLNSLGTSRYKQAIDNALDESIILVAIGTSRENLESEWVRYEWDSFFNDIISGIKAGGQVFSLVSGLKPQELPRALRQSQSFDYDRDGIKELGEFVFNALGLKSKSIDNRSKRGENQVPPTSPVKADTGILFIDIAGSTKIFEEHGNQIAERILGKAIRDWSTITQYNFGWVIKSLGDEIMCAFDSAEDCVRAAVAIHEEIAIGLRGESIQIQVKMGLSFGDTQRMPDNDIFGHAVNVAATLANKAQANQIVLDESTVMKLPEDLILRCTKAGEVKPVRSDELISYYIIN